MSNFADRAAFSQVNLAAASDSPVSQQLSQLADAFRTASDLAAVADTDDTLDAAADAERAMLDRMRAERIAAFRVDGRLYLDGFALAGERGGIVLDLSDIAGL